MWYLLEKNLHPMCRISLARSIMTAESNSICSNIIADRRQIPPNTNSQKSLVISYRLIGTNNKRWREIATSFLLGGSLTIAASRTFNYTTSQQICQYFLRKKLHKILSQNLCKITKKNFKKCLTFGL